MRPGVGRIDVGVAAPLGYGRAVTKRPRAERRALERKLAKEARDRDKLARLEPGGAPERPIAIASASLVEVHARAASCPLCGGALRLEEHTAETLGGARLRVAAVVCVMCGVRRRIHFRIAEAN